MQQKLLILIVNSNNGETISELIVTDIKYGNQIRMWWINNDHPSYIVVGGCKLSANHIEDDIDFPLEESANYIILDGRGNANIVYTH
jgi:hypothetical protein